MKIAQLYTLCNTKRKTIPVSGILFESYNFMSYTAIFHWMLISIQKDKIVFSRNFSSLKTYTLIRHTVLGIFGCQHDAT